MSIAFTPFRLTLVATAAADAYDPRRDDTASKIVVKHDEIVKYGDTGVLDVLKRSSKIRGQSTFPINSLPELISAREVDGAPGPSDSVSNGRRAKAYEQLPKKVL